MRDCKRESVCVCTCMHYMIVCERILVNVCVGVLRVYMYERGRACVCVHIVGAHSVCVCG